MTGIFWTMWPAGSWNWTGDKGIPWKGNYSSWLDQKQKSTEKGRKVGKRPPENPGQGTGMDPHVPQRPAYQIQSHASMPMKNCWTRKRKKPEKDLKYIFRPVPAWETWSLRRKTSPKPMATDCWLKTCPSACPPGVLSVLSAPTAPAKPPCLK